MISTPDWLPVLLIVAGFLFAWMTVAEANRFVEKRDMNRRRMEPGLIYLIRVPLTMWYAGLVFLVGGVVKILAWLIVPPLSESDTLGVDSDE